VVKCHSSFVNIWVCSKEVLAFRTGAVMWLTNGLDHITLVRSRDSLASALVKVNSVKIGIRLFYKWVKPLDTVKVGEMR
jgi:hypothetical protein